MAKSKLLAFLLCERASVAPTPDNRVTLHHLFDRIIVPPTPEEPELFFAYYKIVVDEPCTVALKVIDPLQREIPGNWRDSIAQVGPVQSIWALTSSLFKQPGRYVLELRQEVEDSEALSLASMLFVVEQQSA
ncbi:MAG: hypothetical protein ACLQVM_14355 [Terriglobia bacterium]